MYGMIIRGEYNFPSPQWDNVSELSKDCIRCLMCVDPKKRLDCPMLLKHDFIQNSVDLEELIQEEKEVLAKQQALIVTASPDDNNANSTKETSQLKNKLEEENLKK